MTLPKVFIALGIYAGLAACLLCYRLGERAGLHHSQPSAVVGDLRTKPCSDYKPCYPKFNSDGTLRGEGYCPIGNQSGGTNNGTMTQTNEGKR